jgi:phospholipid/cholesterol/gamma-HCH transport system substrate-binding protein
MPKEVRLGMFIAFTLALLCAGLFLIGSRQTLFQSTYKVKAEFQNVSGLGDGAAVRVGGIYKGTVRNINLPSRPGGKVTVVMDLQRATRDILKKDSVAAIRAEGLIGDKYVEISFGSNDAERLKDGDIIGSEPPLDIADLFSKTNQILGSAQNAVSNMESITSKIDHGGGSIGALINDKSVYTQASKAATNLSESTAALKHNFLVRGFFKNRGYEDSSELAKHRIAKLPAASAMKTFQFEEKQLFDKSDTAKLKNEKALNEAGHYLEQNQFGLVVIVSSAGAKGDAEKEQVLTEARAAVVRDYLVKNFKLDDMRIRTMGLGKAGTENDSRKLEVIVYSVNIDAPPRSQTDRGNKAAAPGP